MRSRRNLSNRPPRARRCPRACPALERHLSRRCSRCRPCGYQCRASDRANTPSELSQANTPPPRTRNKTPFPSSRHCRSGAQRCKKQVIECNFFLTRSGHDQCKKIPPLSKTHHANRKRRVLSADPVGQTWRFVVEALCGSCGGRCCDEWLNRKQLWTLTEARAVIED
jgi:hypothetical protein